MILIDGTEVKKLYLKICSDILKKLEQSILVNIITVRNERIEKVINKITGDIREKAENTDKLVQI